MQRLASCHDSHIMEKEDLRKQVMSLSSEIMLLRSKVPGGHKHAEFKADFLSDALPNDNRSHLCLQIPEYRMDDDDFDVRSDASRETAMNDMSGLDPSMKWAFLVKKLLGEASRKITVSSVNGDDVGPCGYALLSHWSPNRGSKFSRGDLYSTFGRLVSMKNQQTGEQSIVLSQTPRSKLEWFVVSPSSVRRLLWCLLGVCLLTWDTLVIPVQLFPLGEFAEVLRWVALGTSIYWLIDMPFQCFISFQYPNGQEERNPRWISLNYVKTWFAVDLAVLFVDGVLLFLDAVQDADSSFLQAGRSLRLARLMRLLRVVRLMRLRKLSEFLSVALFRIKSEHVILGIKLAKHVSMILLVNHYTACGWYALAAFLREENHVTWLEVHAPADSSAWNLYVMSLHWSMTQFAPATNNIAPQNVYERSFAVCIVLFALISFSSFISSVTNTVNELRTLKIDTQMEELRLREFLFSQKVSPDLVGRILKFFKQNYRKRQKRIHEQDIPFFHDVPESMKIRLHEEVYMPIVSMSPMFSRFLDVGKSLIIQVCHTAFAELFYVPQQDVFVDGTPSSGVYFVRSGRLTYHSDVSFEMDCIPVKEQSWISEMCLWVEWNHCGQLCAETSSELVRLDKTQFAAIISKASGPFMECLRRFAVFLLGQIDGMASSTPVTDISLGRDLLERLSMRARQLWELERRGIMRFKL